MKKRTLALLLAGAIALTASGCGSAFEAEYHYEEPVTGDFGTLSGDATEIRNYSMLKTVLTGMISRREERREFRLSNYNGNPSEDLAAACYEMKSSNPLGAYAVESMSYDTSYVVSYYMANIYISYKRTEEEIDSVYYAQTLNEFNGCVCDLLEENAPGAVIRIYSSHVDESYIRELVREHYYEFPVTLVQEPTVTVESFPSEGANRIYSIHFDYAQSRFRSARMAEETEAALDAAVSELTETEAPKLALEAAEWLCSLGTGEGDTPYQDTAYGALTDHSTDSKGVALAYLALCRRLEIPCTIVEGSVGAMGAEPHFWNIIELDGAHYHVDVSAFAADPAAAFLLGDDALWGTYIWETERYPACTGALTYADVAGLPAPTEPPASEEETAAPAEEEGETAPAEENEGNTETGEAAAETSEEKDEKIP